MVYSNKRLFLLIALVISLGLALALSLPHHNPTTQIDEISLDLVMLWGLPLMPTLILQAGNNLVEKKHPDIIYIRLFSLFWLASALTQIWDKVL